MYTIINKSNNESETMTEREAITKYGTDKVNAMVFGLDPDLTVLDMDAEGDLQDCFEGDYL